MNDFEQNLRGKLNARADAVLVDDDWDDLMQRMLRRSRNTTRALALALVLVVGAGTVAVAASVRDDHSEAPAAVGPKVKPAGDGVVPTNAKVPTVPGAASATSGTPGFAKAASQPSGTPGSSEFLVNGATSTEYNSSAAWIMIGAGGPNTPMARVFTRTTPSGVTIRAYRADVAAPTYAGPPWFTPAAWCFPDGYVRADVSDDAVADATMTGLYAARKDGSVVGGSVQLIGQAEQARRWIVIAQGPANTAKLRATFPGGATDEMAPVNGVAVLVAKAPADATDTKVELTALDTAGNELGHATIGAIGSGASYLSVPAIVNLQDGSQTAGAECYAPQTLPAAGASQPADAPAARQAVIDAFNAAYTHGVSDDAFAASFDDSHGFADVLAKLRAGTFKEQVATAQMKFDNLVFLSPTKAAIQYEIDIPNYAVGAFSNRFNEANLVDGKWKLARYGWCNDVSLAGVQCPT